MFHKCLLAWFDILAANKPLGSYLKVLLEVAHNANIAILFYFFETVLCIFNFDGFLALGAKLFDTIFSLPGVVR